jgi:hypothetical protein
MKIWKQLAFVFIVGYCSLCCLTDTVLEHVEAREYECTRKPVLTYLQIGPRDLDLQYNFWLQKTWRSSRRYTRSLSLLFTYWPVLTFIKIQDSLFVRRFITLAQWTVLRFCKPLVDMVKHYVNVVFQTGIHSWLPIRYSQTAYSNMWTSQYITKNSSLRK